MAPKRPSSSPVTSSGPPAKKIQRKSLTLAKKMEILSRYDQGQKTSVISHALGLGESTLRRVRDNADKIRATVEAGSSRTLQRVYSRSSTMERMEKMLATWIQHLDKTNVPVSLAIIQEKAKSLINDIEGNDGLNTSFQASSGWFAKFKLRHGFHNIKMTREAASADTESARKLPEMLKKTLEEGQYSSKQVFIVDETALYWKKMPARTYIAQEEKTAPGFKASKDRLTLLLGSNAEGDCRLKPVLIYHSQNPRALKGYDRAFLPVHWYANKKGWVTGEIFSDYYKNKLHSELKAYCNKEGIPFKILLLVNNAPNHPASLENLSNNIKLAFLPPNMTSLLQPCDQGLIQMFKAYYLRSMMAAAVKKMNEENKTLRDFWKNFTIKDAVTFIKQSWDEVPTKCLNGVWKKLCPQFVHSFEVFAVDDIVSKANKDTISYAQDLGLDEVEEEDINQLLQSHRQELSNKDLLDIEAQNRRERQEAEVAAAAAANKAESGRMLTANVISEALGKIKEGFAMLEEHDPNVERSTTITRKCMDTLFCYTQMQTEFQKKKCQFFNKPPVQPVTEKEKELDDPETEVKVDVPELSRQHRRRWRVTSRDCEKLMRTDSAVPTIHLPEPAKADAITSCTPSLHHTNDNSVCRLTPRRSQRAFKKWGNLHLIADAVSEEACNNESSDDPPTDDLVPMERPVKNPTLPMECEVAQVKSKDDPLKARLNHGVAPSQLKWSRKLSTEMSMEEGETNKQVEMTVAAFPLVHVDMEHFSKEELNGNDLVIKEHDVGEDFLNEDMDDKDEVVAKEKGVESLKDEDEFHVKVEDGSYDDIVKEEVEIAERLKEEPVGMLAEDCNGKEIKEWYTEGYTIKQEAEEGL